MAEKPNILFIQVDQLTASSLRAYGDQVCHAPTLDSLADNGAVFENAYCNFPLCAPSQFSMATGQLCSNVGAYDNAAELSASIPTYAHYLRELGYQTSLSGKMHFIGPDQFHGFERRLTADLYPTDFSWVPNWGDEGKRDTNDPRSVLISGICERSVQIDFDEEVTYKAIQHIYSSRGLMTNGRSSCRFPTPTRMNPIFAGKSMGTCTKARIFRCWQSVLYRRINTTPTPFVY